MKKLVLKTVLVLALIVSIFPMMTNTVSADEGFVVDEYGELIQYTGSEENVVLPKEIESIGSQAFYGNDTMVTFTTETGSQLTTICEAAFNNCSALESVILPKGLYWVNDYMFAACENLKSVYFDDNCEMVYIPGHTFLGCTSLTDVNIPKNVGTIFEGAFEGCTALESIALPDNLSDIQYNAFYGCTSLSSIVLPNSLLSIGMNAFTDCTSLLSITIPSNVYFNSYAMGFDKDENLIPGFVMHIPAGEDGNYARNYAIENNITYVEEAGESGGTSSESDFMIDNHVLTQYIGSSTNVVIPSGVTTIGERAFANRTHVASVTIPSSVTTISDQAFSECTGLKEITIPANVSSIGDYAFGYCSELESVTISNNSKLTNIGYSAFYHCTGLKNIDFGTNSNLKSIDKYAFYDCCSLESIVIPDTVTSIGTGCFKMNTSNSKLTTVHLPTGITYIPDSAFDNCDHLSSITIPTSVISVGDNAFYKCKSLTKLALPSGLNIIGEGAFASCINLAEFTIPASVTMIGIDAFDKCEKLTTVTIPKGLKKINTYVFSECTSLKTVKFATNSICESIGREAFYKCVNLTTITFPSTVKTISQSAFEGCTNLKKVTVPKTITSLTDCGLGLNTSGGKISGFVMYTTKGSAAQTYAKENGITCRIPNTITASNFTKNYSTSKQTFSLGAKANGAKLTYASSNTAKAKVDSTGKVTIPAKATVGKVTITITAVEGGSYQKATKKITITIRPKKAVISSITPGTKKMTVKMSTKVGATGGSTYQIQYKKSGTSTWKSTTTTAQSKTIGSLLKGKKYNVRVRAYKTVSGTRYNGLWSTTKTSTAIK